MDVSRVDEDLFWRDRRPKRVKSAAYREADGGHPSPELRLARQIEKYGVQAVLARPFLYIHEAYRMQCALNIERGYRLRARSDNWAAFHNEYPDIAELLVEAQKLTEQ